MFQRYIFTGRHGSCGYGTGKAYWGRIKYSDFGCVEFVPLNPLRMIVPYWSEENLFENWEMV